MSTPEVIKSTEPKMFANWREYPLEIKIMDLSTLAWLAIFILEIIFLVANVDVNIRVFPMFMMPIFMLVATLALRLQLVEKPSKLRNIFAIWVTLFLVFTIFAVLILALYPEMIASII